MPILNYTTSISTEKTVSEIQKMLVKHKATSFLTDYDSEWVLTHLSFRMATEHGVIPFRLPVNIDGVYAVLSKDKRVSKKHKTREQAARVAWRICKDWVAAQLAIVEANMASPVEVFLPYVTTSTGDTLYQSLESKGFQSLAHQW